MDLAAVVFDPARDFAARLGALRDAIEAHGVHPGETEQRLLAELLARPAYAIPLELLFGDDRGLPPVLVDPYRDPPSAVDIDPEEERAFIRRFAELPEEQVSRLEASHLKYLTLLGLMSWDACYDSEEAFEQDRARYEIIARRADSGRPIADWETLAYVAGRDWGIAEAEVDAFARMQLVYYFALGAAEFGDGEADDGEA